LATVEALSDELRKIASAQEGRNARLKKFLKSTAVVGAGTGAGYGAGMLAEKAFQKALGQKWEKMPISSKTRLLGAAIGLASAGAFVGREWTAHERKEAIK
jgi:hypothetical protein